MRLEFPATEARVLLRQPQPDCSTTVHALLAQGARIDVEAPLGADPELRDLEHRGLVRVVTEPELDDYEVVLRPNAIPSGKRADDERAAGSVTLVGGGPGDPGLITVAGLHALREADVVVCDRLAPLAHLAQLGPDVEVIHVGKIPRGEFTPQEQINQLLIDRAREGKTVVRLKGGDNFVFGRGGEEWNACMAAGVTVRAIPGVTSAIAAPALAGIPVTHRDITQGFIVVSGHVQPDDDRSTVDWPVIARSGLTIVILMGVAALDAIAAALIRGGLDAATPSACISNAGMPSQRVVRAQLGELANAVAKSGVDHPAVTIIGHTVAALHDVPGA
ncbi:MAG: uroporphyrinogen-III C-methyltransferase [Candidatus Nanopelagicales bacterium]